jgi:hypothetical protein
MFLRETNNLDDNKYIIGFLNSERLNSPIDDDKTLLLCLWERE